MICDTLSHWNKYDFGPAWQAVMAWLEAADPNTAPAIYTVDGCSINISDVSTKTLDSCLYESHKRMIDVQLMLSGMEFLYTASAENLAYIDPFDEEKDMGYHVVPSCETACVTLAPKTFAVLFPWDAHMSLVAVNSKPAMVRKAVAKIPVELFLLNRKN